MRIILIAISVFLASIFSCNSKEENAVKPKISDIPEISLEKMSPNSVQQFSSVFFEIKFTDGDGDIGREDADILDLEILDTRDSILNAFHIPPQSPVSDIAITGILSVELENLILLDQNNLSEEVIFNLRLTDRAGNVSNTETSDVITVMK